MQQRLPPNSAPRKPSQRGADTAQPPAWPKAQRGQKDQNSVRFCLKRCHEASVEEGHQRIPWRCCTNRHEPARCPPTGSSPADAIRHWSAEGGHPIEDLTAEDGLTPLPGWTPGAKTIADDGLVADCPVNPRTEAETTDSGAAAGHCQVDEKLVDRPPRYWARASREPAMLGIKNGRRPQLDNTLSRNTRASRRQGTPTCRIS